MFTVFIFHLSNHHVSGAKMSCYFTGPCVFCRWAISAWDLKQNLVRNSWAWWNLICFLAIFDGHCEKSVYSVHCQFFLQSNKPLIKVVVKHLSLTVTTHFDPLISIDEKSWSSKVGSFRQFRQSIPLPKKQKKRCIEPQIFHGKTSEEHHQMTFVVTSSRKFSGLLSASSVLIGGKNARHNVRPSTRPWTLGVGGVWHWG